MTNLKFAKGMLWINGGIPLAILFWDWSHGLLGPGPVNTALHVTGIASLVFLLLSLLVTPIRKLSGWNDAIIFRRVLGLWGFYYAAVHFGIFYSKDQSGVYRHVVKSIVNSQYQQVGLIALLAMVPQAITSTNFMVRLLGPTKWSALHRLTYLAIAAGVLHYIMQGKTIEPLAIVFAWIAGALLLFRYGAMFFSRKMVAAKPRAFPVVTGKPKFWKGQLKVARVFSETPDTRTFRLTDPDGKPVPFDYKPGQYLNLTLLVDGKKVNRSYTIASTPSRSGAVELTVKREAMGVSSRHLHDRIREGDLLDVSAPAGKFTFDGMEAGSIVLIAGGVGITPVMSVLRYLTDCAWNGEIYFIYSARTEAEVIFKDELTVLAKRFPNLHLVITLTREEDPEWTGRRGRITAELLKETVPDIAGKLIHICGPDPMMDPVRRMLKSLGVPDDKVRTEKFESPKPVLEESDSATPIQTDAVDTGIVTFMVSGKTATADGRVILDLAEDAGVEIPFDCRAGVCGTCKVRLISGRVSMDNRDALSAADEKSGLILACQSHPAGDVRVEI